MVNVYLMATWLALAAAVLLASVYALCHPVWSWMWVAYPVIVINCALGWPVVWNTVFSLRKR